MEDIQKPVIDNSLQTPEEAVEVSEIEMAKATEMLEELTRGNAAATKPLENTEQPIDAQPAEIEGAEAAELGAPEAHGEEAPATELEEVEATETIGTDAAIEEVAEEQ